MSTTSVSRALTSLKNFDKTFTTSLADKRFAFVSKDGKDTKTGKKEKDLRAESFKNIQAARNQIEDSFKKRAAITKANSEKLVNINGTQMSLLEALIYKNHSLPALRILLAELRKQERVASNDYQVQDLEWTNLIKEKDSVDVEKLKTMFKPEMYSVSDQIQDIEGIINFFDFELDALLNEINPTLMIEV